MRQSGAVLGEKRDGRCAERAVVLSEASGVGRREGENGFGTCRSSLYISSLEVALNFMPALLAFDRKPTLKQLGQKKIISERFSCCTYTATFLI